MHYKQFLFKFSVNPLSANPTKWLNALKQFVGKLPTNCLSVFNHFVGLALKGLLLKAKFGDDPSNKLLQIVEGVHHFVRLELKGLTSPKPCS